ncbi:N-terminal cleavage protein [Opitutaceae bacterium TAV5]|nr:N-terminal cleavage protein [Opitutaceae bacterium TAV5]
MKTLPHNKQFVRLTRNPGFTLIELLTVIAIIGVLAGLMLATLGRVRSHARSTQCKSNLRQIGVAAGMYSVDDRGYIVPAFDPSDQNNKPLHKNHWTGLLAAYMGRSATGDFSGYREVPVFVCPGKEGGFGYGHNYFWLSKGTGGVLAGRMNMSQADNPSRTVLFTDQYHADTVAWRGFVRPAAWGTWKTPDDYTVSFRHSGDTCNVVWLDGHVSSESKNSKFAKSDDVWRLWSGQTEHYQ